MNIYINGRLYEFIGEKSVKDILEYYNFSDKRIIVEYNGNFLNEKEFNEVFPENNSKLEIMRFTGGG